MRKKKSIGKKGKGKVFVTGASGMLGTDLYKIFTDAGFDVLSTDKVPLDPWTKKLDIRDISKLSSMVERYSPDYFLNLAALTDIEYCESNPQETYDVNAEAPIKIAKVCYELGIPLVHISTAGVFDGLKDSPYTEEDTPNPVNIYGKAKHISEVAIPHVIEDYFIFRAGWMMGAGERDKKFVRKVLNIVDGGADTIYGLIDMYGCPTYTYDFASGILHMILSDNESGLYNMVSEGNCTRYDVAKKMVDILNLNVTLEPVSGNFFEEEFFAPRPPFEVMENKKLHDRDIKVTRHWEQALEDYLNSYYKSRYGKKGSL